MTTPAQDSAPTSTGAELRARYGKPEMADVDMVLALLPPGHGIDRSWAIAWRYPSREACEAFAASNLAHHGYRSAGPVEADGVIYGVVEAGPVAADPLVRRPAPAPQRRRRRLERRQLMTTPDLPAEAIEAAAAVRLRPWWCQDPTCTPAASDTGAQLGSFSEHPEYGGFCCGTVPAPIEFDRHGQHHVNDGHLCFRSAVRGVVMLEVNEGDLDAVCRVAMRGLLARDPDRSFNAHWYLGRDSWTGVRQDGDTGQQPRLPDRRERCPGAGQVWRWTQSGPRCPVCRLGADVLHPMETPSRDRRKRTLVPGHRWDGETG